ncbi:MAG: hypothetical protein KJ574_04025, partial [Nanoarchaeota archaeon]|nr:hypothetical protein [Nanoarchaeota archaeon]
MTQPKRAIYANLFCPTLHYPAIDYLLDIKSYLKKGDKLYLCFWDQEVYPFQRFGDYLLSTQTYDQKIKDVVRDISAFLTAQGVNHEIVYMSDAFKRVLSDEQLNELLFFILSKINVGHIEDTYGNMKYLAARPVTVSKIVYLVADYLIGAHFTKLFSELTPIEVTDFYTGERFKAVIAKIEEGITEKGLIVSHPRIIYAKQIPILNYSSGNWISITMSKNEVEREVRKEYPQEVDRE